MASVLRYIPRSITKLHGNIIPVRGEGSYIFTRDNNKYLDFTSGIGALSTGHQHPYVISKVKEQLNKITHTSQQIFATHEPQIELTEKLLEIMPNNMLNSVFYTNSGSEAIDNAIKISRRFTEKTNIIALRGGFHGRTLGALSISSSGINFKYKSQPLVPGVFFCDEPNKECLNKVLEFNTSPEETAAIIIEPVQGEGGVKDIPIHFLEYVREVTDKNNIMFIADEIQCGFGRTGDWWNITQKCRNLPDLITFGKGIGSGFPIAGIASNSNILDSLGKGYLGGTYGGNALVSTAASATIDVIKDENILENVNKCGTLLGKFLDEIECIREVRQYGLMIAIEFYENEEDKIIALDIVNKLRDDYGILVLLAGNKNQYIRILPPLNISEEEVNQFVGALRNILYSYNK